MHPDQKPRTHHPGVDRRIKHHHRQIVGQIVAVFIGAAYGETLSAKASALSYFSRSSVSHFRRIVHLHECHFKKLLCEFLCYNAISDVLFVIRIQPLIHSAV